MSSHTPSSDSTDGRDSAYATAEAEALTSARGECFSMQADYIPSTVTVNCLRSSGVHVSVTSSDGSVEHRSMVMVTPDQADEIADALHTAAEDLRQDRDNE